jgi:hypothetical protein
MGIPTANVRAQGGSVATNGHSLASPESCNLCDCLFAELSLSIPDLFRNPTKGSCGLYQNGKARFAYVYHSKTMAQVEIWCRGDKEKLLSKDPGLGVAGRDSEKPGWEQSFPARFRLHSLQQAAVAARYLTSFSYPAASSKSRRHAP